MQLSKIPHYTTPQNFAVCTSTAVLERIISSFIFLFDSKGHIFADIDATGFKITGASHYHTSRTKLKSEYAKLSIGADVLARIVVTIKVRRGPARHEIMLISNQF